jgi:hypothetical protein
VQLFRRTLILVVWALITFSVPQQATAQPSPAAPESPGQKDDHAQHRQAEGEATAPWHFMQDGALFGMLNVQGSPRGETEGVVTNWWMGMWGRQVRRHELMLTAMFSLEPATLGPDGYSEIFQVGETLDGQPLVDRQHPHDLLVQAGFIWRYALTNRTGLSIGAAPVGEPALGPVAFMHRPTAVENPTAPLGHHIFDSTHISMGVVTATLDRGPWVVEASAFNGREPDEQRWDLMDPGALDSWSARVWFQPGDWQFQLSHGVLVDPEPLEPGTVARTTGSVGWFRLRNDDYAAAFVAIGKNVTHHGDRHALLAEASRRSGRLSLYSRLETLQVEADKLIGDAVEQDQDDPVTSFTLGGIFDVLMWHGVRGGLGADITLHGVPALLEPAYGSNPVSFRVFFRLVPPVGPLGRMWNMRMSQPMMHPPDSKSHEGHHADAKASALR